MALNNQTGSSLFEVPLTRFHRDTLDEFQKHQGDVHDPQIFKLPLTVWKYVAQEMGPTSHHPAGKYLRMVDYYDLPRIAQRLDTDPFGYQRAYRNHREQKKQGSKAYPIGWAFMDIWGGNRDYHRIIERKSEVGYVQDTAKKRWLVTVQGKRYDITAHKVNDYRIFSDWKSFRDFLGAYHQDVFQELKKYYNEHGMKVPDDE